MEGAHEYVSKCGRTAYIAPVYDSLIKAGYRHVAYEWFKENESFYHPIAASALKGMLLTEPELDEVDKKNIARYQSATKNRRVRA